MVSLPSAFPYMTASAAAPPENVPGRFIWIPAVWPGTMDVPKDVSMQDPVSIPSMKSFSNLPIMSALPSILNPSAPAIPSSGIANEAGARILPSIPLSSTLARHTPSPSSFTVADFNAAPLSLSAMSISGQTPHGICRLALLSALCRLICETGLVLYGVLSER